MTSYAQYQRIREGSALQQDEVHPIHVRNGSKNYEVCSTFGVHPDFPLLAELYAAGEAVVLVGTGTLIEPLTKTQYSEKTRRCASWMIPTPLAPDDTYPPGTG